MPTPRRRPWGQLWSAAPWDGKTRPPEPLRIPNTVASPIDTPPPRGTLSLRRRGFGRLLASAPWAGPAKPVPAAVITDGRVDFDAAPAGPTDDTIPNTLSARARNLVAEPEAHE